MSKTETQNCQSCKADFFIEPRMVKVAPHGTPLENINQVAYHVPAGRQARQGGRLADELLHARRLVAQRCLYGVDKNPMAVELAKVALWLHTFTVGAPLSFLDHHLRCGDSLFGSWVRGGIDKATEQGSPLLLHGPVTRATSAASSMQTIEGLTDAEIAEAHRSASIFDGVLELTVPLDAFLSLVHAFDWLNIRDRDDRAALHAFFDGQFGDPIDIALGRTEVANGRPVADRFAALFGKARELVEEERFLNWQVMFPGVWSEWQGAERHGGFDAVIGNPLFRFYLFSHPYLSSLRATRLTADYFIQPFDYKGQFFIRCFG